MSRLMSVHPSRNVYSVGPVRCFDESLSCTLTQRLKDAANQLEYFDLISEAQVICCGGCLRCPCNQKTLPLLMLDVILPSCITR